MKRATAVFIPVTVLPEMVGVSRRRTSLRRSMFDVENSDDIPQKVNVAPRANDGEHPGSIIITFLERV